jgi:hypothetical protein
MGTRLTTRTTQAMNDRGMRESFKQALVEFFTGSS